MSKKIIPSGTLTNVMEKNIYKAPALNISPKHTIQTIGSTMHTELRKQWNPAAYINKFLMVLYKDSLKMINQCNDWIKLLKLTSSCLNSGRHCKHTCIHMCRQAVAFAKLARQGNCHKTWLGLQNISWLTEFSCRAAFIFLKWFAFADVKKKKKNCWHKLCNIKNVLASQSWFCTFVVQYNPPPPLLPTPFFFILRGNLHVT